MRVLVCGGRGFDNHQWFNDCMNKLHAEIAITELCHGGAKGADTLAHRWAQRNGISVVRFDADWAKHGRQAGPIRNIKMLTEFKPERVVAFPGGRGTNHMVSSARAAGVAIINYR